MDNKQGIDKNIVVAEIQLKWSLLSQGLAVALFKETAICRKKYR